MNCDTPFEDKHTEWRSRELGMQILKPKTSEKLQDASVPVTLLDFQQLQASKVLEV